MELGEYQKRAQETDRQQAIISRDAIMVPLLGLAGETGTLLSAYKKFLRDGDAHRLFKDQVVEDLGDILWYLANLAERFDVSLDEVAEVNLAKVADRFGLAESIRAEHFFDSTFPVKERLPRWFQIDFLEERREGRAVLRVHRNGEQVGDYLTDNAFDGDGYRFHDAFHFAYATMLGWSPVTRHILKCKRRSDQLTDEVEDGGRARVFEESIAALVFQRAREHDYYATVSTIDNDILKTIKTLVSGQEVRVRTSREWERAILDGLHIWRQLNAFSGGSVTYDLENRAMAFVAPLPRTV